MIFKVPSNPTPSVGLFLVSEDPALENWLLVPLFSVQEDRFTFVYRVYKLLSINKSAI